MDRCEIEIGYDIRSTSKSPLTLINFGDTGEGIVITERFDVGRQLGECVAQRQVEAGGVAVRRHEVLGPALAVEADVLTLELTGGGRVTVGVCWLGLGYHRGGQDGHRHREAGQPRWRHCHWSLQPLGWSLHR